jgi:hypothetical protein
MAVMTRRHEDLLDQLVELAGDPLIVQRALRDLNAELEEPPKLEQLVRRILELKAVAEQSAAGV